MLGTTDLTGVTLGSYEIQALLGSGGMANVYRGFDLNLRRPVAIKVLSEAAAQPDMAARFRQEARLIASLRHPYIVKVYDFGEQDGLTYMVQELLPGPTLQQRLHELATRGERMGRAELLAISAQLASALDAAHAAGIIHRDVKPANAIWNASGALALTDFGIAKNTLGADQTQIGMLVGTPNYLSPEQAHGQPPTPASDIYALGVVLYEMIAGRPPFDGDTMRVVMDHVQTPPPPLRQMRPDLPPDVEAVVLQALAKDPAARFRSAAALARALEHAWPAAPAAAVAPADIHSQPTRLWEHKPGAAASPAATPALQVSPAPRARRGALLPLFSGLLALLLLGGVLLAARGAQGGTGTAPVSTAAPAAPTRAPIAAAPQPTAPQPTAPQPSPTPAPQPSPAPQPTAAPAPSTNPLGQLRALLVSGIEAGKAGKQGDKLLKNLDAAQQALAKGDKERAADQLHELAKNLTAGADDDKIDRSFAQQALDAIDAAARSSGLTIAPVEKRGKGKGH